MTEALSPTKERLSKSEHWDHPEVDSKTNRKASRVVDDITRAWRKGTLEFAHLQSWEGFYRHWQGVQKHDVRVSDFTNDPSWAAGASDRMPAWQFHGMKLAEARSAISSDEFQALELMCMGWGFLELGAHFGGYKTRQQAEPYARRMCQSALERLALEWGFKQRQKVPIR
jgi:hypothetical protein